MKRQLLLIYSLAAFLVIFFAAIALWPRVTLQTTKLSVVAAENFWGSIAAQIAGERATVTSIIEDPETDPHLYESGAKDASVITKADIVITNGLGFDDFVDKLLEGAPNQHRSVVKASSITNTSEQDNPHIWYDYGRVKQVANAIETRLSQHDPAGSATYKTNLATFLTALDELNAQTQAMRTAYPTAPVAYTERVPGYLLQHAGLKVMSPESFAAAIEAGNEPSPADQAAMLALIHSKQIRALIYNAQAESPVTEAIRKAAQEKGIPIVAVTETMPPHFATYQEWQAAQLDELAKALENTK